MLNSVPPITVLWDSSHIWGLMSLRSLRSLGFPVRLLKAVDIAQGALLRKQEGPEGCRLLLVPGGSARLKSDALGEEGRQAVRDFVSRGGRYLGFCGGSGLALSQERGIGLCPWGREEYPQRFLHLLSGYVLAEPSAHELTPEWGGRTPSLPVWWPGRFSNAGGDVDVLARYRCPDRDFWIGDIALETVPERVLEEWKKSYGVNLTADFLADSELIVHGVYGKGEYVLSYSHLETPDSPDANAWFAHILSRLTGWKIPYCRVHRWEVPPQPLHAVAGAPVTLRGLTEKTLELVELAAEHRFFFRRTPWLVGWKTGMPGSSCNSLLAALCEACELDPSPAALAFWGERGPEVMAMADEFFVPAEGYFLTAHLSDALRNHMPSAVDGSALSRERDRLFGHPMRGAGIVDRIVEAVEEYIYLCLAEE